MKKLNMYFFEEEKISLRDSILFYGTMSATILAATAIAIPLLIVNLGGIL